MGIVDSGYCLLCLKMVGVAEAGGWHFVGRLLIEFNGEVEVEFGWTVVEAH